jgi:cytoskeleton protein RodZ
VAYDMKRQPRPETSAEAVRVGEELRNARFALGASLDDMAERLRINRRYLAALEEGRVRDLPGVAYATGFVRSYAQVLGLNAPALVRRFREGAGVATAPKDLVFPEPVPERGVPAGAIVMVGAVLAVAGYAAWYHWSGSSSRTVDNVPELPPRLEQAARDAGLPPLPGVNPPDSAGASQPAGAPPANTATPRNAPPAAMPALPAPPAGAPASSAPSAGAARPPLVPPQASGADVPAAQPPVTAAQPEAAAPATNRIVLRATQDAWIQVRDPRTGRSLVSRILRPDEAFEVPENGSLVLTTGRAEGLAIEVDGKPSAALQGLVGVRRDIFLDAARLREAAPGQVPTR